MGCRKKEKSFVNSKLIFGRKLFAIFLTLIFGFVLISFVNGVSFGDANPANKYIYNENVTLVVNSSYVNSSTFLRWNSSLMGYWSFDYYNSTGIYDNSSYGNFGSFNGGLSSSNISSGIRGNALDFDGVDDYMDIPDILINNQSSFSLWVNPGASPATDVFFDFGGSNNRIGFYTGASSIIIRANGANHIISNTDNPASLNEFNHIVFVTNNGTFWDVYMNGNYFGNASGVDISNTYIDTIGKTASFAIDGSIDELMIFNRSLSNGEILALYNGTNFSRTFDGLGNLDYTYYACEMNSSGNFSCTETRTLSNNIFPNVSSVSVEERKFRVEINFQTNDSANATIEYSTDDSFGNSVSNSSYSYNHSITLPDLNPETAYNYRIVSFDKAGDEVILGNFTFTTTDGYFYVDAINGNDSNNGTSSDLAWKTISKVNSETFYPGDAILFKRGDVWNETLVVNDSGNLTHTIVFGAYGSGEKPLVKLSVDINSSWNVYSGNIYYKDIDLTDSQMIFVNGTFYNLSRYPNSGEYLRINSSDYDYLIDSDLGLNESYIVNSSVVVMTAAWQIEESLVAAYNNETGRINFSSNNSYASDFGNGYYLENKLWMLDSEGEWFYDNDSKRLYVWIAGNSSPENSDIELATGDFGINLSDSSYVSVSNFSIKYSLEAGIYADGGNYINISECSLSNHKSSFIDVRNSNDSYVGYNDLTDSVGGRGIYSYYNNRILVEYNNITNQGMLGSVKNSFAALSDTNVNSIQTNNSYLYNRIVNSGYIGFNFHGSYENISYNFFNNSCLRQDDCAGIYTYNAGKSDLSETTISSNIILNSIGSPDIASDFYSNKAHGIYLDDETGGISVTNNIIYNAEKGIFLHNARNNTITNNTLFARDSSISLKEDSTAPFTGNLNNNTFSGNVLFGLSDFSYAISLDSNTGWQDFGNFNSSYFGNLYLYSPIDYFGTAYNISQWKDYGQDFDSEQVLSYYNVSSFSARVYFNDTQLINNSYFDSGISGWEDYILNSSWESDCGLVGGCARLFISQNSSSIPIFHSSNSNAFPVSENNWYKISFYSKTDNDSLLGSFVIRNSVSPFSNYIVLKSISLNNSWRKFEYYAESHTTDLTGARFDINVKTSEANKTFYVDNVSVVETELRGSNEISDDYLFYYNDDFKRKSYSLDSTYSDIYGNDVASFTLQPFESKVLLATYCNNDGVCNNNENSCTCANDCSGTCPSTSSDLSGSSGGGSLSSKLHPSKNSLEKGYSVRVRKNQTVEIIFGDDNKTEEINVKNISEEGIILSVGEKDYFILNSSFVKIDLDGDGFYDIKISNKNFYSEGFADLEFTLISEKVPSEKEDSESENVFGSSDEGGNESEGAIFLELLRDFFGRVKNNFEDVKPLLFFVFSVGFVVGVSFLARFIHRRRIAKF